MSRRLKGTFDSEVAQRQRSLNRRTRRNAVGSRDDLISIRLIGGGPKRPDANWMSQPRPRVTRLPKQYRSESELARRRRLRRDKAVAS